MVQVGSVRDVVAQKLYRVTLSLGVPADSNVVEAFTSLASVSARLRQPTHTLQIWCKGIYRVLKKAADYPVLTMTSHEPTLEEAFLSYYRPDAPSEVGTGGDGLVS